MKNHKTPITPVVESHSVKALLKFMNKSGTPIYVKSSPNPNLIENECFSIVENYILSHGGEIVIGWALWELPSLYIEAEFHAIWKSPNGEFIDLNSRALKTENILFLADKTISYEGFQVNSFRIPLTNNIAVRNFLNLHDKLFEFRNRGDRKYKHGEIELTYKEENEYKLLIHDLMCASLNLNLLTRPLGIYDPCVCGSGKKAKWCHKLK